MLTTSGSNKHFDQLLEHISHQRTFPGKPTIPVDAYRENNTIWVHLDLQGQAPEHIEVSEETGVLTLQIRISDTTPSEETLA